MAIHSFKGTVAASGVAQKLSTGQTVTQIRAGWVIVQFKSGNSGNMYVGDSTLTTSNSPAITGGNSVTLPWMGTPGSYDLSSIFVTADTGSQDYLVLYGRP